MSESRVLEEIEACCMAYKLCVLPRNPKMVPVSVWELPDVAFHVGIIWRQNTGAMQSGRRFVRFGIPGQPDFAGWLFKSGQKISIEAKTASGKNSNAQEAYWQLARQTNVLNGVARSYDDCAILLESWGLRRNA